MATEAKETVKEAKGTPVDTKKMLFDLGEKGESFRYRDRMDIEYIQDYGRRKKGEIALGSFSKRAEWLIENKFAKEYKAPKETK